MAYDFTIANHLSPKAILFMTLANTRKPGGLACLLAISFLVASHCHAENWPGWRGIRGDGSSIESGIPTRWDAVLNENISWKSAIPGVGHSSPIVWNHQVFVASCIEESGERVLICLDRDSGKILWQRTVFKSPLEIKHNLNSCASGTPTTDGRFVYASFLEIDGRQEPAKNVGAPRMMTPGVIVVAKFSMDGEMIWIKRPSAFSSAHGFCSSPVLFDSLVIVNGDHDGDSSIMAIEQSSGEVVWKFPRVHQTRSYCTPILREFDGKTQLILSGSKQVVGLNPKTGSEYWHIEGPTEQFVASMVSDNDKVYLAAGYPDYFVTAIRPTGAGDVSNSHVAWHSREAKCYVPSPVLVGEKLIVVDDRGTINCFATSDGKLIWKERLGGHFSGSLVTANGLVYCTADDGTVTIVEPSDPMKVIAKNPLGEFCFSSPAISDGQLFFRGERHLIAVGKPAPSR